MGEPAIAVRGLRKSFGAKEAVAGIDLEIAAGSLAGLVGPNGAGKTTSLSMMTGLLRPDGGQVADQRPGCVGRPAAPPRRSWAWCRPRPSCSTG